jgi:MoxR-like ATPase
LKGPVSSDADMSFNAVRRPLKSLDGGSNHALHKLLYKWQVRQRFVASIVLGLNYCLFFEAGDFPAVLDNLWLEEEEAQAVATALQPKLSKAQVAIEGILGDIATLEVALRNSCDPGNPVTLANLMPRHWADFIRNSDITDAK